MKQIFYSLMAVVLCSCAQSEVDDAVTPPQPEKKGLKFEVVNDGFVSENGTRVTYGSYGEDGDATAYQAKFENKDAIGIFAIKTSGTDMMVADGVGLDKDAKVPVDAAYTVKNAKLTYSAGNWTLTGPNGETEVNFGDADLLFAYAPYDVNKVINNDLTAEGKQNDGRPSFIKNTDGSWALNKKNNRFFTYNFWVTDFSDDGTTNKFKANDWMGAVAKVPTSNEEKVTFNMIHMRGMVEVTTDKDVELTELTLSYSNSLFKPYLFTTTNSQKVYRVLTTEYRNGFDVKAKITDNEGNTAITKTYKRTIPANEAGICSRLNVPYVKLITVSETNKLEAALKARYGDDYATDLKLKSLRLAGELSEADWTTLQGLTKLQKLDMSQLTNTSIPDNWMKNATTLRTTLTSLVLPKGLTTIGNDALQFGDKEISIELPASVTELGNGAFYKSTGLSLHIPENSSLKKIGDGAFWDVKAVYTDSENVNVLKIPTGVTAILSNAFLGVQQLEKIIFQSTAAPAITNGVNQTINNDVLIYVPNTNYKKTPGLFPGNTVVVGPVLTADNYVSSLDPVGSGAGEGSIGVPGLCDNDNNTFWHTPWGGTSGDTTYGHYIDITLPEGESLSSLMVKYVTRHNNSNAVPTKINIYTSSNDTWGDPLFTLTKEANSLPTANGVSFTSEKKTASALFTKIRFAITEANNQSLLGDTNTNNGTALAELLIGEEIWTE